MLTITITINDPDAARVQEAFGRRFSFDRPATDEEIKVDLSNYIRQITLQQEQQVLIADAQAEGANIPPVVVL
jgi:hypothetical protein